MPSPPDLEPRRRVHVRQRGRLEDRRDQALAEPATGTGRTILNKYSPKYSGPIGERYLANTENTDL